jgi:NAD(P)-dependent dehydrogenase (short-subunit alcohol dehydrogenase family)
MGRLEGRVAIITGAGEGIGRGIARRFAAEGAKLLIAELDAAKGRSAADELAREYAAEALALQTDAGDKQAVGAMVEAAVRAWGTVDILVNNAWGGGTISRVERKTDAELAHGFGLGFYGPFWAMRAVFPWMKAQRRGNIVNVCSLNGVNAHMGSLEYNVAKEALRSATRTAAREWAPHGIVLNAICPAAKSAAFRRVMAQHPELEAAADSANPMGRIGDPERDIAPVVAFLASDDARYLTGNTLFVDGGAHINGVSWAPQMPE